MRTAICVAAISLLAAACAGSTTGPSTAPAAENAGYAASYPSRVRATSARYESEMTSFQRMNKDLKDYPDELQDPDWELAEEIYELANDDGQSGHYADTKRDNAQVLDFFSAERQPIVARTSSSANYQAKEKNCDVQLYGAVDHGLEAAISEQLEEREKKSSQAQGRLEDADLPKNDKNVAILKKQAQQISTLSYLAHVSLQERSQELEALVAEASQVKRTLAKQKEQLKANGEAKNKEVARARAEKLASIEEAEKSLDDDVRTAETLLSLSDQQVEDARTNYDQAFEELIDAVRERQGKEAKSEESGDEPDDKKEEDEEASSKKDS